MTDTYNLKAILEIIFSVTKKNAKILADEYLLKDVSIISKWRNNVAYPRNYDVSKIVEFVITEATVSQKGIIRDSIEELLRKAPIKSKFKKIVFDTEDFGEFLKEAISVSISVLEQYGEAVQDEEEENVKSIIGKDNETKQNGSYTGTVELDFILPEGGEANLKNLPAGTGIEFKGKLNLTPRKKVLKVANFLKSRSVLGVIVIWVVSGSMIVLFTGLQKNNSTFFSTKNNDEYSTPAISDQVKNETLSIQMPTPTIEIPSLVPSQTIPSPVPLPTQITGKSETGNFSTGVQKENKDNTTKNKTNNTEDSKSGNISVNVNGNGNVVVAGPQNGISIEEK